MGIGASAGGVDALTQLVRHLPSGLPAAVCVVLHVPATSRSLLAPILARHTDLAVQVAEQGEPLVVGRIYVAPPDRHLTVSGGRIRLERGPKENGARPAVDPMLRSLAAAYGERAVAIVLSGALGDGSLGALAVRRAGGTVLVQDPEEATVASMPESALRTIGEADAVRPAAELGPEIARVAEANGALLEQVSTTEAGRFREASRERPAGAPTAFSCPECDGPLWEQREGDAVGYRCRIGHAFSEDSLVVEQGSAVEAALWSALEALEERAELLQRVGARHGDALPRSRARCEGAAADALARADLIRAALGTRPDGPDAMDLTPGEAAAG